MHQFRLLRKDVDSSSLRVEHLFLLHFAHRLTLEQDRTRNFPQFGTQRIVGAPRKGADLLPGLCEAR